MSIQNQLGQYFTTNMELKNKIYELILNNPDEILEPSIGQGDLVDYILSKKPHITFDMYEIDSSINLYDTIDRNKVIYADFLTQNIIKRYKTIIGNPPYIKAKKKKHIY